MGEPYPRVGFIVTNLTARPERRRPLEVYDLLRSVTSSTTSGVRLLLFVPACNLENFLRRLGLSRGLKRWSLRRLRLKLIKMGGRIVRHARHILFPLAEVAVPRDLFAAILG